MLVPRNHWILSRFPNPLRSGKLKGFRDLVFLCCEQLQDGGWTMASPPVLALSPDRRDIAAEMEVWRNERGEVHVSRFGVNYSHARRRPLRFFCCGDHVVTGRYLTRNHLDKLHVRRSLEEHVRLATHNWFPVAARDHIAIEESLCQRRLFRCQAAAILLEASEQAKRTLPNARTVNAYREYIRGAEQSAWRFLTIAGKHIQRTPPLQQYTSHHDMGWIVFSLLHDCLTQIP